MYVQEPPRPNRFQRIVNTIRFIVNLLASKQFWMAAGVGFFFTWLISNKLHKAEIDTGLIGLLNAIAWMLITWGAYKLYTLMPQQEPQPQGYPEMPKRPGTGNGDNTHGSANWSDVNEIDSLFNDGVKERWDGEGYYIGESRNLRKLTHAVTVAGSGQGKGVCLVLPNLLKIPTCSWFVMDPKGENASITAAWQKSRGQKVVILDPWDEQTRLNASHGIRSTGFNPLSFIQSNPYELPESCGLIADMLVPDKPRGDQYWDSRARALIKTYLMHLLTIRPKSEHHLGTIYRWLRYPLSEREALWKEMYNNGAYDNLVRSGIGEFLGFNSESNTLPSIVSTAQDATTFLESLHLRASLEQNEFDPYELTNGKTTVYLCLPERFLHSHSRWLRLVVGVCLKACNYRPNKRVNFLLDEFAILGKMQDVERAFAFARGQNISMWILVQSLTQLIDTYGEHAANTFLSNARLRQFFGVYDLHTQKYLSEYLGDTTVQSITKNQSTTETKTTGTSTGKSSGATDGTGLEGRSSTSTGKNDGKSESTSTAKTEATTEASMSRRLLTNEEIGKYSDIITLIDGYKFSIARIPYWKNIYQAWQDGDFTYYPKDEKAWRKWIDDFRNPEKAAKRKPTTRFYNRAYYPYNMPKKENPTDQAQQDQSSGMDQSGEWVDIGGVTGGNSQQEEKGSTKPTRFNVGGSVVGGPKLQ